jgi:hypothetical protein
VSSTLQLSNYTCFLKVVQLIHFTVVTNEKKNIAELSRPQTLVAWLLMGQLSTKELNRASYSK